MKVIKRDGREVDFDTVKIRNAIKKAMEDVDYFDDYIIEEIITKISSELQDNISVEDIQDIIIKQLYKSDLDTVAKAYSEYRHEQNRIRKMGKRKYRFLSDEFLSKYKHKADPFPTELGKLVFYRTYSRPLPEEGRREFWWETVARVVDFNCGFLNVTLAEHMTESVINGALHE